MSRTLAPATESAALDSWSIAGLRLRSRLLLGTARYPSRQLLLDALAASGTELVTVALRRVDHASGGAENLYQVLRERGYTSCRTPLAASPLATRFSPRSSRARR
jgi:thiazole synthase ThiGH ThiG subunit